MLQTERIGDDVDALRAALEGWQTTLQTCLPAIVKGTWDTADNTVTVQPAIQGVTFLPQGNQVVRSLVTLPLLIKCPVQFPRGGGFALTFPIADGDEGLVHFSSRAFDAWWQNGGIQAPIEDRMHHFSDAFFVPGVSSIPHVISGISTGSIRISKLDQSAYAEVTTAGAFNVVAPGGATINGVQIASDGTVTGPKEATFNGHTVGEHTHGGVTVGSGTTSMPTG